MRRYDRPTEIALKILDNIISDKLEIRAYDRLPDLGRAGLVIMFDDQTLNDNNYLFVPGIDNCLSNNEKIIKEYLIKLLRGSGNEEKRKNNN